MIVDERRDRTPRRDDDDGGKGVRQRQRGWLSLEVEVTEPADGLGMWDEGGSEVTHKVSVVQPECLVYWDKDREHAE